MLQEPKEIMFWFFRNNQLIVRSLSIALQHHTVIDSVFVVSFTAMEDHYRATTIEDDASITAHYEASERRFVDLHFLLPCKFVRRIWVLLGCTSYLILWPLPQTFCEILMASSLRLFSEKYFERFGCSSCIKK